MIKAANNANHTLLRLKDVIVDVINAANIMRARTILDCDGLRERLLGILPEERLVLIFGHRQKFDASRCCRGHRVKGASRRRQGITRTVLLAARLVLRWP